MSEWRPIETAPKDGSGVMLIAMDAESPEAGIGFWRLGEVWSCIDPEDDPHDQMVTVICWENPTHWMPLPDPPTR